MKRDLHDNLPRELLLPWTSEQLDCIHGVAYWADLVSACEGAEVVSVEEMEGNEELWADWLAQDNGYAANDRKSMDAGAGKYLINQLGFGLGAETVFDGIRFKTTSDLALYCAHSSDAAVWKGLNQSPACLTPMPPHQ